ncbi:hypothetical protein ACQ4LE_010243 [Meloidogyne hapla]|uniref:Lysozyme n=1 Tax=Meloidogyne hapla TaxID=6305 RepID=A0A1I8B4X0_MELHA
MNIIYLFLKFLFLLSLKNSVNGAYGGYEGVFVWDSFYGFQTFKCLKNNFSAEFAIVQAFTYKGVIDKSLRFNYFNAKNAGICDIDVYIYPCVQPGYVKNGCGNAKKTIDDTLDYLKKNKMEVGRVWLSIFGLGVRDNVIGWDEYNIAKNIEFIEEMINTLKECKQDYGIYTAKADWLGITGNTQKFKEVPLLYTTKDASLNNFDDFVEFGGWTKPSAKLYVFKESCGITVANIIKPTLNNLKNCYDSYVKED